VFCPRCHERIVENWSFCPRCGARLASQAGPSGQPNQTAFTEMFKDIQKQLEEALKGQIDGNIEFVDLKPEFIKKNPMFRTGGFRVKVTRSGDGPPSIDIKAFGDVDEKLAEKMNEAIKAKAEAEKAAQNYPTFDEEPEEPEEDLPETREVSGYSEPTANTTWAGDHVVVDLDLPGVKSLEDISIKKLDESIEVRAYAGKKGYFKILSIPKEAKMLDKSFDSSKLTIRIG
jgi:hypothetical protein